MKFAQLNAFGIPSQVVDCIEGEEPGAPGADEVCLAKSYYLCKSPSFHRLVNPGGSGTIGAHA